METANETIIVPHDLESEMSLLGAWMSPEPQSGTTYLTCTVPAECFYFDEHVETARAIASLALDGNPVDPVTVGAELQRKGLLDKVGGVAYLRKLVDSCPSRTNADYYAENVLEMAKRRQIMQASRDAYDEALSLATPVSEVRATLASALVDEYEQRDHSIADVAQEAIEQMASREEVRKGWPTPRINVIAEVIDTFRPGRVGIVAGLPGTGKSSIAGWWVMENAMRGIPTAFISLEMDRLQIMNRMIAATTGLCNEDIDRFALTEPQQVTYAKGAVDLSDYPIRILDDCPPTEDAVMGALQRLGTIFHSKLVVVDYLQLVYGHGTHGGNRNEELARFTARLKSAAKDLDLYILEVSQLSRESVKEGRKPRLQDLRDSGGLEQNADDVILLSQTANDTPDMADVLVDIAKHRSGKRGTCAVTFNRKTQSWGG